MLHIVVVSSLLACAAHDGVHERLAAIEARIALHPLDGATRVERARALREHGAFERALDELETAERLDPCAPRLDYERGVCLMALGCDAEAQKAFDQAIARSPTDASAFRARARCREQQGAFAAALEDRRAVIQWAIVADPELFLELADAELALGSFEAALAALDRGVERLGMAPALVLRAIAIEERRGDVDGALARLDEWARSLPRKETALVLRGEILERSQRLEAARRAWTRALAAIEDHAPQQRSTSAVRELAQRARAGLARLEQPTPAPAARFGRTP